jgi:hypothetical protein
MMEKPTFPPNRIASDGPGPALIATFVVVCGAASAACLIGIVYLIGMILLEHGAPAAATAGALMCLWLHVYIKERRRKAKAEQAGA